MGKVKHYALCLPVGPGDDPSRDTYLEKVFVYATGFVFTHPSQISGRAWLCPLSFGNISIIRWCHATTRNLKAGRIAFRISYCASLYNLCSISTSLYGKPHAPSHLA